MKNSKRLISLCLTSLAFLVGCSAANSDSTVSTADNIQHLNLTQANLISNITDNEKYLNPDILFSIDKLEDTDKVNVIITLNDKSIADSYLNNPKGTTSLAEYVAKYGSYEANNMKAEQNTLAASLIRKGLITSVTHSYTTLLNGFAAETTYGMVSELEEITNIKKVSISEAYSLPTSTSSDSNVIENVVDVYDTGIFNSSSVSYTGNNTAVAILDSGFDVHHSVFKNMPEQPLLAKSDVNSVLKETAAYSYNTGLKAEDVYLNAKIPFQYDYADKDSDVAPYDSNHGTHVAGIIGGKDQVITGVAINTQLVLMKVFGDTNNGALEKDILAALEDSVKLGVDAINMSLGTSCGFSRLADNEYLNSVYDKIEAAGISLVVAASNDYSSAYGGAESNTNKASNPDSATVGSPSTYSGALSVASISGVKSKYISTKDGYVFFFNEANSYGTDPYDFYEMLNIENDKDVEIEYITVPGYGKKVNYSSIDVKGKIALVKRGDISFEEKAKYAYEAGAIGCIVYNNIGGEILMSAGNGLKIPFCSISKDDGEYLAQYDSGILVFNTSNQAGPFMSDFSSWGPTADLKLKPEITAHGGEITSAVPGGGYDTISGTSMACPNMCGIVVLVRQYLKEKFPALTTKELCTMTNQLLMSTATIALDKSGNPYSPRKQGSGLANLYNAVNTLAYITVDNSDKAKVELGDDKDESGIYTLTFNIVNISDQSLSYELSNYTMTESLSTSNSEYVAEKAHMFKPSTSVNIIGDGTLENNTIIVNPNGTVQVEYTLKLSNAEKKYIRQSFDNGMYVEGFATLNSNDENGVDLSVPFLAFFGDWTVAPIFDKTYYEVEADANNAAIDEEDKTKADYYATTPLGTYYYSYIIPLGSYIYTINEDEYDLIPASEEHAAMGYDLNTINGITAVYAGLLRNAKKVTTTITNTVTGEVVYEHINYDQGKAHYSGSAIPSYDLLNVTAQGLMLQNNVNYTFTMLAELDYGDGGIDTNLNNTFTFSFYVDYEAPIINDAQFYAKYDKTLKENRYYVDLYVTDNHYVQSVRPFTLVNNEVSTLSENPIPVYADEKNSLSKVTIEITDYMDLLQYSSSGDGSFTLSNGLGFCVDDYALNSSYYYVTLPGTDSNNFWFEDENGNRVTSSIVKVGEELDLSTMIKSDDPTFKAGDLGQSEYMSKLDWNSANENVARVKNGKVEGITAGRTTITASTIANDGMKYTVSISIVVRNNSSLTNLDSSFSNSVTLKDIDFKYFDTLTAFDGGPEISEIGEVGDRIFLTHTSGISFYPGERVQLGYEINPWNLDPSRYSLEWSSTNDAVASVDENGIVSGLKEGSATITLRIKVDGKQSNLMARVKVTVKSEFVIENRTLIAYKGLGGDVVIPDDEGIMYIDSFAFSLYTTDYEIKIDEDNYDAAKTPTGNTTVTSVTIPYDVTEVRKYAFYNCSNLETVTFSVGPKGETCKIIREHAFEKNVNLKNINLSKIEVIGESAFKECTSLTTVDFTSIYALGAYAFEGCSSLSSVDLTTLRSAGARVFKDCTALSTLVSGEFTKFSDGMFTNCALINVDFYSDRIPDNTFLNCKNLANVTIHNNLIYVGASAFEGTTALIDFVFLNSCDFIYEYVFLDSGLQNIILPNSSFEFEKSIFDGCYKLKTIKFNENTYINKITENILNNCSADEFILNDNKYYSISGPLLLNKEQDTIILALPTFEYGSYEIASSIKNISTAAFSGIKSLTSLVLPDTIEAINDYAFANCTELIEVTLPTSCSLGSSVFKGDTKLASIINIDMYDEFSSYIFSGTALTSLELSSNKVINEGAFSNISTLVNVSLGNNTIISSKAFMNSNSLTTVSLGTNTSIDDEAFANCTLLSTINLVNAIDRIGDKAFIGCSSLKNIDLANVSEIGDFAFSNCLAIESIDLSGAIKIGDYAFSTPSDSIALANKLTTLNLPKIQEIGKYAFNKNLKLETVIIGSDIKEIGEYAFANCSVLATVTINGDLSNASDGLFENDGALINLTINGLTNIGNNSFYGCSSLTTIDLSNVVEIGVQGFYGCRSLTSVDLPKVKKLNISAFLFASSLTNINMPTAEYIDAQAVSMTAVSKITLNSNISYIAPTAFYDNKQLTEFNYVYNSQVLTSGRVNSYVLLDNGVLYITLANGKLQLSSYPTGKTDIEYSVINNTARIEAYAGANNTSITKLVLPQTLKLIGNMAFYGCPNLKTVEFESTVAPTLEGTILSISADYDKESEVYKLLNKYFQLNGYYPLYYGHFNTLVGFGDKLNIILPANSNLEGYDSVIYSLFFDLDNKVISKTVSLDKYSLDFLDKIKLVPTDNISLNDEDVIVNARTAYNAVKQDLTKFGYTKEELNQMEQILTNAEAKFKELMLERVEKKYDYLIEDIKKFGSTFDLDKISEYFRLAGLLENVNEDYKKYIDYSNLDNFKTEYDSFFKNLNDDSQAIKQIATLSTNEVTKVGLASLVIVSTILVNSIAIAFATKKWI
ncbi:MAG: leucine-rich repeat protein [Anaeroplasma sp.]